MAIKAVAARVEVAVQVAAPGVAAVPVEEATMVPRRMVHGAAVAAMMATAAEADAAAVLSVAVRLVRTARFRISMG